MNQIEARDLATADHGVDIVLTAPGGITYVGWLAGVVAARGRVLVMMEDVAGPKQCTILVADKHPVHVTPFEPIAVGDIVRRRGWDDPEKPAYNDLRVGLVLVVARDDTDRQVYKIQWDGESVPRWMTRRMLARTSIEEVAT